MATAAQLQTRIEKLTARIKDAQAKLAQMRNDHKDLKTQLVEAKKAAKAKAGAAKGKSNSKASKDSEE